MNQEDSESDLVEVCQVYGELHAQLVRSLLEDHGIPCIFRGESLRLTHGLAIGDLGLVHILVRTEDAPTARTILAEAQPLEPEEDPE